MANMNFPFGRESPRRAPTPQEGVDGFPCGQADRNLFNGLHRYYSAQLYEVLDAAGLTPNDNNDRQLLTAIRTLAPLIEQNRTITVNPTGSANPADPLGESGPADAFDDISSAIAWLRKFRIRPDVLVTVAVDAGTYSEIGEYVDLTHPDGMSISVIGATMTSAFPTAADVNSANSQVAVESLVRNRFAVKVNCGYNGPLIGRSGLRLLKNIAFFGPTGGRFGLNVGTREEFTVNFGGAGPASTSVTQCWFHNFELGVLVQSSSHLTGYYLGSTYNGDVGAVINHGSYFQVSNFICFGNGGIGVAARYGAHVELIGTFMVDKNTGGGLRATHASMVQADNVTSATCRQNGLYNVSADGGSHVKVVNTNLADGGVSTHGLFCSKWSSGHLVGCSNIGTVSPAHNTTGNVFASTYVE
jgi:hypothetical protein